MPDKEQMPSVYRDGGDIVVRASASGKCIQQLCRYLAGYEPSEMFFGMKKACKKGEELESVVVAELIRRGYPVENQQRKVQWRVLEGLRIQGSMDGTSVVDNVPLVVEIKTRNRDRYNTTKTHGPEGIPSMLIQGFSYATALGLKSVKFCTVQRHEDLDDLRESLLIQHRTVPPYFEDWMQDRMQTLVDFSQDLPDCEGDSLWCPFRGCPSGCGTGLRKNKDKRKSFGDRRAALRNRAQTSL